MTLLPQQEIKTIGSHLYGDYNQYCFQTFKKYNPKTFEYWVDNVWTPIRKSASLFITCEIEKEVRDIP